MPNTTTSSKLSISTNPKEKIGQEVISIDQGLGQIRSIENLQDGVEDYFVVEFSDTKTKNYFPVNNNLNLRLVSSEEDFKVVLDILINSNKSKITKSINDRRAYFNRSMEKNCIKAITTRICELIIVEELTIGEQKILDKLVKTLVLEASIVLGMSLKESKQLITKHIEEQNG